MTWLANLAPRSQPMRSKTKANRDLHEHVFILFIYSAIYLFIYLFIYTGASDLALALYDRYMYMVRVQIGSFALFKSCDWLQ